MPNWGYGFGSLAAPNSQVVQSDEEYLKPFQSAVDEAALRGKDAMYDQSRAAQTLAGQMSDFQGYNSSSNPSAYYYTKLMGDNGGASGLTDMFNTFQRSTGYQGLNPFEIQNFDLSGAQAAAANQGAQASAALRGAATEREQNAQRQTQAYGQMQGGNYFGGMVNEGYSDPFSGQVGTGTTGGLGGLGGMPTSEPNAFASYNASWQPEAKQRRAGSWGSPFGGQ